MTFRSVHSINLNVKKPKSFQKMLRNSSLRMKILQYFAEFTLSHRYKQEHFAEFIFANRGKTHKIKFSKN